MNEIEKYQCCIDEITSLINQQVTSGNAGFITWKNKAELLVHNRFGPDSLEYKKFAKITFHRPDYNKINGFGASINQIEVCKNGLLIAKGLLQGFLDDIAGSSTGLGNQDQSSKFNYQKVFIVHGHDGELKEAVARIIGKQDIDPIILSEKANKGRTIIEKFEENSDAGGAICLFTADDIGREKTETEEKPRARQNVVFEAGFFMGKLGRDHVVLLADSGIEMPSDLSGVVYTNSNNWQLDLLKELNAMGYVVDANKLL